MTPAARVQAAIELLDQVIDAAHHEGPPADRLLADWFRARRFAGSGDRRAIRELVYAAIRACGPVPPSGRAAMLLLARRDPDLAQLFDNSPYGPACIDPAEPVAEDGVAPAWLVERLAASDIAGDEAVALLGRAPLDLRVNALKAARDTLSLPEPGEVLIAPHGLRFPPGVQVEQWPAWRDGLVEVQDCGSQLACQAVGARSGETVIDLCAGAGGKTLALAALMGNEGTLIAADTDRGRLSRLAPRADRAGARIDRTLLLDPGREDQALGQWQGRADRVLVDAPCSGTGTWRRNPEARWRLTAAGLARLTGLQARLLEIASRLVRPGGSLAYVTCSLLDEEGPGQVEAFLARHPGWRATAPALAPESSLVPPQVPPAGRAPGRRRGPGLRLTPHHDGTDGFFIARIEKPC